MAYFELLARDYTEWLASAGHERPAAPDFKPTGSLDPATCAVLSTSLFEIEQAGVFSAVCASLSGVMLNRSSAALPLTHLVTYAPPLDESYRDLKKRLIGTGAPAALLVALETHHARLDFAQRLTRALVAAGGATTADCERDELEKLHDAWCRVCTAALRASEVVRDALQAAERPADGEPFAGRAVVLEQAAAGANPCVNDAGRVTVPGWAEKRKAARFNCNAGAVIECDGEQLDVVITDASVSGLGVRGLPQPLLDRSAVTIILGDDERLKGQIVWCRKGAAGIALEQNWPGDHPLLKRGRS